MWWATITNVTHQSVSFTSVQFSQQFHTCCSFHHLNPPHIQCRSLRLLPTPVNHHGTSHEASFYYSKCRFTKSWHHHFLSQGDTISQSQTSRSNHLPYFSTWGETLGHSHDACLHVPSSCLHFHHRSSLVRPIPSRWNKIKTFLKSENRINN